MHITSKLTINMKTATCSRMPHWKNSIYFEIKNMTENFEFASPRSCSNSSPIAWISLEFITKLPEFAQLQAPGPFEPRLTPQCKWLLRPRIISGKNIYRPFQMTPTIVLQKKKLDFQYFFTINYKSIENVKKTFFFRLVKNFSSQIFYQFEIDCEENKKFGKIFVDFIWNGGYTFFYIRACRFYITIEIQGVVSVN